MTQSEVLEKIREGKVFELMPSDFRDRLMTHDEITAIFRYFNALWRYQGNPRPDAPHALLTSGLHSDGFIDCDSVLCYPKFCELFAHEMVKVIHGTISNINDIGVVVSSAYSAIKLGWEIARLLSAYNPKIEYRISEKDKSGHPTIIRRPIDISKKVLIINELMTTGAGSTIETKQAVNACNGEHNRPTIIQPSFVFIHRSHTWVLIDGSAVKTVVDLDIKNFDKDDCPYCKAKSSAIKPKIGNNWAKLHGQK